jgi:hypothetical protein
MTRPNTFLVGAPKCGTTSIANYLASHPDVFFSRPKEVNYFNADHSALHQRAFHAGRSIDSDDAYLELFRNAPAGQRIVAEGSVWYLASSVAVPAIMRFNPEARLIVMLRNPIDMAPSLHAQQLLFFNEDEPDLARAWELQDARRRGVGLPRRCLEPQFLQYREMCSTGRQVERLLAVVPRSQCHLVVFDDLVADPARVWAELLGFLGLDHDGRTLFPSSSERRTHRIAWLNRLLLGRGPAPIVRSAEAVKRALGVETLGVRMLLVRFNLRQVRKAPIDPELLGALRRELDGEIRILEGVLGRDLRHWRSTVPGPAGARSQ